PLADAGPHRGLHLAPLLDRPPRRSNPVPRARPPRRTGNPRAVDATQRPLRAPVPSAGLRLYRGGHSPRGCRPGHRADRVTRRGWALFAAMAVIWGIPYLLIKIAVGELTPASLVFLRTLVGAALLLPVAAARGWLAPLFPYWRWVLVYTVVEVSAPWFLLADGERRLSSSLTGLMIAAVPLLAAVIQQLTRADDRMDRRRVTGLLVGFAGVAILVGLNVSFKDLGAVGEVGLVALGYAAGPIIIARRLPSLPAVGVGAVVGFSLILAGSMLATRRTSALGSAPVPSSTSWGAVARYRRARQRRSQG